MVTGRTSRTVLAVEDDPGLRDLYVRCLEDRYRVRTAAAVPEALDECGPNVDVVVLDRRLPSGDGLDALDDIDARTDGAFVVCVTGVDPGLDVVDVGVDDYLVKPLSPSQLVEAVDALVERQRYERDVARYFALASRRAAVEAAHGVESLRGDERYEALVERIETLRASVTPDVAVLEKPGRTRALYRDLGSDAAE